MRWPLKKQRTSNRQNGVRGDDNDDDDDNHRDDDNDDDDDNRGDDDSDYDDDDRSLLARITGARARDAARLPAPAAGHAMPAMMPPEGFQMKARQKDSCRWRSSGHRPTENTDWPWSRGGKTPAVGGEANKDPTPKQKRDDKKP